MDCSTTTFSTIAPTTTSPTTLPTATGRPAVATGGPQPQVDRTPSTTFRPTPSPVSNTISVTTVETSVSVTATAGAPMNPCELCPVGGPAVLLAGEGLGCMRSCDETSGPRTRGPTQQALATAAVTSPLSLTTATTAAAASTPGTWTTTARPDTPSQSTSTPLSLPPPLNAPSLPLPILSTASPDIPSQRTADKPAHTPANAVIIISISGVVVLLVAVAGTIACRVRVGGGLKRGSSGDNGAMPQAGQYGFQMDTPAQITDHSAEGDRSAGGQAPPEGAAAKKPRIAETRLDAIASNAVVSVQQYPQHFHQRQQDHQEYPNQPGLQMGGAVPLQRTAPIQQPMGMMMAPYWGVAQNGNMRPLQPMMPSGTMMQSVSPSMSQAGMESQISHGLQVTQGGLMPHGVQSVPMSRFQQGGQSQEYVVGAQMPQMQMQPQRFMLVPPHTQQMQQMQQLQQLQQLQQMQQMQMPQMMMMPGSSLAYSPAVVNGKAGSIRAGAMDDGGDRKSKFRLFKHVPEQLWRSSVDVACKEAFARLNILTGDDRRGGVMKRISEGRSNDTAAAGGGNGALPCYLVKRGNMASTSPFQLQVSGARILVQKAIYAAYQGLSTSEMGTWQVVQKCLHRDGTWWCFEPTHLEQCYRDHAARTLVKHPIPSAPDAIYAARYPKARSKKGSRGGAGRDAPLVPSRNPPAASLPAGFCNENAGQHARSDGLSQIVLQKDESDLSSTPGSDASSDDHRHSAHSASPLGTVQLDQDFSQYGVSIASSSIDSSFLPLSQLSPLVTTLIGQGLGNDSEDDFPGSSGGGSTPLPPQLPSYSMDIPTSASPSLPHHDPSFILSGSPLHLKSIPGNADESNHETKF